jgi:hypothetical protein
MLKEMPCRNFSDRELNDYMMMDLSLLEVGLESAGGMSDLANYTNETKK